MGLHRVTDVPDWFTEALADRPVVTHLDGSEVRTACRTWGAAGDPLVVLVHGGAAHAGWWDHVAPFLTAHRRVVALDLAGHGDSGWVRDYSLALWTRQVVEVVRHESPDAPAVLVGHSLGGAVAMLAAHDLGPAVAGLLMVDTEIPVDRADFTRPEWVAPTTRRVVPDRAALVARFRTLPSDDGHLPYVTRHVAEGSVTAVEGGWSWKFDPRFFGHDRLGLDDVRPLAHADLTVVRGGHGLVDDDLARRTAEALGRPHDPVTVPGSGHHVPLDQPVALTALVALAARTWSPATTPPTTRPTTTGTARVPEGAR